MYNTNQFMQYPNRQPYYMPSYANTYNMNMPVQDIRFLNADQIKSFIPPIGSTVALIDRDNSLLHLESADSFGNLSKQIYSFKKLNTENEQKKIEIEKEYATKDELETLKQEVEKLRKGGVTITTRENIQTKQEKPL